MQNSTIHIPSEETCRQLLHDMGMLDHIDHSWQVCRVAVFLVDQLAAQGIHLNRELVFASALLHDITKTRSFSTGEDHALTGAEFLQALGYPDVARIVGQHVLLDAYFVSECLSQPLTEAEIVNYADKRVLHDRIVGLPERKAYILDKYGQDPALGKRIQILWKKTTVLETRIFRDLPFSSADLAECI